MREGNCAYSGLPIPKGSGTIFVQSDNKAVLLSCKKVRRLNEKKIKSRKITWTQSSRERLKKENVTKEHKIEIPRVVKIVRGFPSIPAHIISERQEKAKLLKESKEKKTKEGPKDKINVSKNVKVSKSEMRKN